MTAEALQILGEYACRRPLLALSNICACICSGRKVAETRSAICMIINSIFDVRSQFTAFALWPGHEAPMNIENKDKIKI